MYLPVFAKSIATCRKLRVPPEKSKNTPYMDHPLVLLLQ